MRIHPSALALLASLLLALPAAPADAQYLTETREIVWSDPDEPDLRNTAAELATPVAMYEYVRNNFDFALYDGARSNSVNTFLNRRGNDVDIASVLIAMLRSQGVPARYVSGRVTIDKNDVSSWLEIPNVVRAANQLVQTGFRNVQIVGQNTLFDHVWIQAHLPLDRYRAAGPAALIDCNAEPQKCTWIDLDPSFKLRSYRDPAELVDISDAVFFDYDSFYNADNASYTQPDGLDRSEKSPLEVYEEQILQHLQTTPGLEGKTLEDTIYEGEIIREEHGILPTSPPFDFDPALAQTWASVDDHDAAVEPDWTKTVRFTVKFPRYAPFSGLTLSGGDPIPLADLSTQNLSFAYESTDFDDPATPQSLIVRLGGQIHETVFTLTGQNFTSNAGNGTISGDPPDVNTPFDVILTMDASSNFLDLNATYPDLSLGGSFVVATGGEHSGWSQVRRSAERLIDAVEQNPVIEDGNGDLIVDLDGDGTADPGEPLLLEDSATQDLLTGGVLAIAKDLYYAQIRDSIERTAQLQRTTMPTIGFLGVVSSIHDVSSVDGTAFQIIPTGLLVDMKALTVTRPYKIDANSTANARAFRLAGHNMSSLEHEIWQEITGYEAISTMKGIQRTLRDGAELMVLDEAQSTVPIQTALANWGFGTNFPPPPSAGDFSSIDMDLFGLLLWLPRTTAASLEKTLDVVRENIDSASTDLEKKPWALDLTNEGSNFETGFFDPFADVRDQLLGFPAGTNFGAPFQMFSDSGCINSTSRDDLLDNLDNCFFSVLSRPAFDGIEKYTEYFDKNAGFVAGDHLYRDYDPSDGGARHISSNAVAPIRDDIVLGAGGSDTVEYVVPTEIADGELIDFAIWIVRTYDSAGFEKSTGYIINRAGGGFVTGSLPTLQNDPLNINYNNQLFSDSYLPAVTNNSPFTSFTGDPIATVTGNVFHDEQDLRIRGRGLDYLFTRTYNSGPTEADPSGAPMGHKWSHSYNVRLIAKDYGKEPSATLPENSDGLVSSITYVEERGGERIFGVAGDPSPIPSWSVDNPRGTFDTLDLSQGASQLYTLRFRNGTEYVFGGANLADLGAVARLLFIRDAYGNELSFGYTGSNLTSIQDNLGLPGRTGLTLSYFGDGRLQQITDWTGRTWKYTYDGDGNLSSAENPLGHASTYGYGHDPALHRLSEVAKPADRDGDNTPDVVTTFGYYANGRGFSNNNSFGKGERVEYDLFRKRTRITDFRGFVSAHFYDRNGELTKMTQPDGGVSTYKHNPDGRRWSRTNALGFTTQYSYCTVRTLDGCASDTGGNLTLEVDALGHTIEYDYDPALFDQITRVKDKNGAERVSTYYATDNPATGEKRGKLHEVRLTQLGGLSNVLLQEFAYNPDGTVRTRVEYIEPGSTLRTRTTSYSYTDNGLNLTEQLTTGSDGTSQTTSFSYDALGRIAEKAVSRRTSPTDPTPIQLATGYNYDAADQVTRVTDPMGNHLETDYDANGKVIETRYIGVDPQSGVPEAPRITRRIRYDEADRGIEVEDVEGNTVAFSYDAAGNRISVTDATNSARSFDYDSRNQLVGVSDENGHTTTSRYDQGSQLIASTDPSGNTISHEYNALGHRIAIRDALGNLTTFTYDANGNPTGQVNAKANADPGNSLLVNSFGQSLTRAYDQLGRVVQVTGAMDAVTQFEYDLLGNRTRVTDAKGQVTEFVYDDLSRLVQVIDSIIESPDKRDTREYDEAGNVIASTDREGNTVRTTYDVLNRAVRWDHVSSGDIDTTRYDAFGNVVELVGAGVTYTFGYDTRNLLTSKLDSRLGRSLLFEYDAAGRATKKTDYQGDNTYFQYDGSGRLISERNAAYLQVSYHYDPSGRLLNRILSNGAQTDYTYDAGNRLLSLTSKGADGATVHTRTYSRDAVGNITTTEGTDGTIGYSYDALHRLLSADLPGTAQDRSFGYDAVGNRLAKTTATETLNYFYGAGNRLNEIRLASDNTLVNAFVYDDNGAMLEKRDASGSAIWSLSRDARGRVATLAGSGLTNGPGSLQYDMQGARVRQDDGAGTRLFHLDGDHLEAVYDAAGAVREKYLRGVVIDEIVNGYLFDSAGKPENLTFHHDHLNSVVALTGHSGTAEEATRFSPFGETVSTSGTTGNAIRYTGRRQVDGAGGLYYYRARYYDSEIGRFLSEDPLGFSAGMNFYAYVDNNPVNANDPTGKCAFICTGIIGGAIGAVSGGVSAYMTDGNVWQGAIIGGATGALIGSGFAYLAPKAAIAAGTGLINAGASFETALAAAYGVEFGAAVGGAYLAGNASSVASQTADHGFGNVDFGIANNSGLVAAGAAVIPAFGSAAMATSPVTYPYVAEALTVGTLGVVEAAIGLGSAPLFQDFTTPSPYAGSAQNSPTSSAYCMKGPC